MPWINFNAGHFTFKPDSVQIYYDDYGFMLISINDNHRNKSAYHQN